VVGPNNTQEYWYYPDHDSALAAATPLATDLLGRHEDFIGRRCAAIMQDAPGFLDKAGGWTEVMRGGSEVKVTLSGVVGDSCMFSNIGHLLHGSASTRARLAATPATFALAMNSREIIRSARHPTLRLGGLLIGPDFACDHGTLLPPFFPLFRGSDTNFSTLLSLAYPTHATADLPWLVTHHSLPGRRYSGRGVSEPWRVSVVEAVGGLLIAETPGAYRSLSNPLLTIGERVAEFASRPPGDFAAVAEDLVDGMIEGKAHRLRWLRDGLPGAGPHYLAAIRGALDVLAASAADPRRFVPVELAEGVQPEQAMARLQRLALRFGELLQCWRDIDTVTRQLASAGVRLPVPLLTSRSRS
jgi:hypothetical protein